LLQWKGSNLRKPLVLRGNCQVGKTYILTEFAKREYEDHVYINFDEIPHLSSFFNEDLDPDRIIKERNIYLKKNQSRFYTNRIKRNSRMPSSFSISKIFL